jgi:hypothetical protein
MTKALRRWFLFFPLALLAGCALPQSAEYSAADYYADEDLMNRARSFHYQDTYNVYDNEFIFDRDQLSVKLSVYPDTDYHFGLTLSNDTDQPLVIDWNRIEYIDIKGQPHSVIHQGISHLDPVSAQIPTTVPPRETITDLLQPADRRQINGVWRLAHLNPPDPKVEYYEDTVTIVMPIKALGVFRDYRFTLTIGHAMPGALDDHTGF